MNKEQAKQAIENGSKITHKRFLDYEYIMAHPKSSIHYLGEDGSVLGIKDFWRWRTADSWNKDWTIFKKKK